MSKSPSSSSKAAPDGASQAAGPQVEVIRALRLGWLASEVYGLVRHGALTYAPHRLATDKRTGRLSVSDRDLKDDVLRLDLNLRAMLELAELLAVVDPAKEDAPLPALSRRLSDFLARPREVQPPALGEVHAGLEAWSMQAWALLLARNELAARAFSYGASIGDTFWFMRRPNTAQPAESERETWEGLLRPARLTEQSERIGELEAHLSPYVALTLKHGLLRWGVAGQLRRYARGGAGAGNRPVLQPDIERKLFSALSSQTRIWRSIILGERTPESYLELRDLSWIRLLHVAAFTVLAAFILFFLFLFIWIAVGLAGPIFFQSVWDTIVTLQPTAQAPTLSLKDIISSLTILTALLAALWAAGRWVFEQATFGLYDWLGKQIRQQFIQRRTYVAWDRDLAAPRPPSFAGPARPAGPAGPASGEEHPVDQGLPNP